MLTRDSKGRPQAYLDTFSGLIPCYVVRIDGGKLDVILTGNRGAYKRGECIEDQSPLWIIPRGAVYRSRQACGQYRFRAYDWHRLLGDGRGIAIA